MMMRMTSFELLCAHVGREATTATSADAEAARAPLLDSMFPPPDLARVLLFAFQRAVSLDR
jgi:hypothetical protein